MKSARILLPLALVITAAPLARAVVVGDKPTLSFTAIDGTEVDLQKLRGNLVVVNFWAISDLSRSAEQTLVELNRQYAEAGVKFVDICCVRSELKAKEFISQVGMTWPQYWDGKMWQNPVCDDWDHRHVGCVLIGTKGDVLWLGPVTLLQDQLKSALVADPPTMVDPDTLAKANASLDAVNKSLEAHDNLAALKLLAALPAESSKNKVFAARLSDLQPKVDAAVVQVLGGADAAIAGDRNLDAVAQLQALEEPYAGTAAAPAIRQRLDKLLADPATTAQLDHLHAQSNAAAQLAAAKKLKEQGAHGEAYQRLKAIVADNPNTAPAAAAQQMILQYENDPVLMQAVYKQIAAKKADAALSLARSYAAAGDQDQARQRFRKIIAEFPDTSEADDARHDLAALPSP